MTTGWLVFILGMLLGAGIAGTITYLIGYRNGHLDGYQDHRAEVNELKNKADTRKAPGTELKVRAKTGPEPSPAWYQEHRSTTAGVWAPELAPGWYNRIPATVPSGKYAETFGYGRPQPAPEPTPNTVSMPAVSTTGELRAATDAWVAKTQADGEAWRQERGLT